MIVDSDRTGPRDKPCFAHSINLSCNIVHSPMGIKHCSERTRVGGSVSSVEAPFRVTWVLLTAHCH